MFYNKKKEVSFQQKEDKGKKKLLKLELSSKFTL